MTLLHYDHERWQREIDAVESEVAQLGTRWAAEEIARLRRNSRRHVEDRFGQFVAEVEAHLVEHLGDDEARDVAAMARNAGMFERYRKAPDRMRGKDEARHFASYLSELSDEQFRRIQRDGSL